MSKMSLMSYSLSKSSANKPAQRTSSPVLVPRSSKNPAELFFGRLLGLLRDNL